MQQILDDVLPDDAEPLTQVLQQSRYYAKYRMLKDNNLFLDDENDKFIAGCAIESDLLQKLHGQALHQLPILTDLWTRQPRISRFEDQKYAYSSDS